MPIARVERRLAAIMAADIVGYSRLIETDEARTLAAIRALRSQVLDPLIADHKGRIVKLMGDGAIVEFGSVVDAVACAVALQQGGGRPSGGGLAREPHRVPRSASILVTWWWKATTCSGMASTSRRGLRRWRSLEASALPMPCRNSLLARRTSHSKILASIR